MFIPAKGCVLIKPLEDTSIIASTDRQYERMGEVIDGTLDSATADIPNVKVGDIICFDDYTYRRFTYDGKDYCVVNISEPGALWGIIKRHVGTETSSMQEAGVSSSVPAPETI